MKGIYKISVASAVVMLSSWAFQSCTSEAPFSTDGEGLVKMNVVVNARTTRSILGTEYGEYLKDNCRIYISNDKGVLHKWVGVDNVPEKGVALRYGSYVAEGFAGDSVTASFDKVYFKGVSEFSVSKEASVTQVSLKCNIANVVASVDPDALNDVGVSDLKIVVANTLGKLEFTGDDLYNKGYYMMPQGDTSLTYSVTGKDLEGKEFSKEGEIPGVLPAHEYHLQLKYDPEGIANGGAFIKIVVEEESLVEEEVVIYGKPSFAWVGSDDDIEKQIVVTEEPVVSHTFIAAAYGFSSLTFSSADAAIISAFGGKNSVDLCVASETGESDLKSNGIDIKNAEKDGLSKYYVIFTPEFFKALPESDKEYVIDVIAKDTRGKESSVQIRIANTEAAITEIDPVVIDVKAMSADYTTVSARSVSIPFEVKDPSVENLGVQYRKSGTSQWNTEAINITRASETVTLKNLDPGTEYEYRAVGGIVDNGEYAFKSAINKFTTETEFSIVNGSFEDWSTYTAQTLLGKKTVNLPGSTGDKLTSFWGSGNEGAATAGKVLTNKSEDMKHSGTYSVRLGSASAMGIIAAGNIFIGHYVETDGTNGVLSLGREYNGSHPSKVRVYANYRPGSNCKISNGNDKLVEIKSGGTDHGQIYVALTDEPIEIRTNPDKRKLFDGEKDSHVLAYGQVTWTEAFGPEGDLQMVEIPFEYNSRAKTKKPTHIVIVASASKFGDYFCGSDTSVMYLDDFELVYE